MECNAYRRELRFFVLKYQELSSISVQCNPKVLQEGKQERHTGQGDTVAEEHGAEVDKGHLEYSERLLGKVGPV